MLNLVNVEYGGYKDKTQYIVYDDEKNEITGYTDTQLLTLKKKGFCVKGVVFSDGYYSIVNNQETHVVYLPSVVRLKDNGRADWTYSLTHTNEVGRALILEKPVYINRVKSGTIFFYKHLKISFQSSRPINNSLWTIIYNYKEFGRVSNEPIDDIINILLQEIDEIIPFLKYSVCVVLHLNSIECLNLSYIYNNTKERTCSINMLSLNEADYIYIGRSNLQKSKFSWLLNLNNNKLSKEKKIGIVDFSDCYNDYDNEIQQYSYDTSATYNCLEINKNIKGVIVLSNKNNIKFNKSLMKINKLEYLGTVKYNTRINDTRGLMAKRLLLNKGNVNYNYIVLVE